MKISLVPFLIRRAKSMKVSFGRTRRIALLISLVFLLKVVSSCIDPVWDFDFSFNNIAVKNLDNSGIFVTGLERDTMYTTAGAFMVTLSDETFLASRVLRHGNADFTSFTPASAMSPEFRYHPRHRITGISIVTLEELSAGVPAGTDVTGMFVAHVPHFIGLDFLYLKAEELPAVLDLDFYPGEPSLTFQLFCKQDITNNTAQFVITVTLSDETVLTATTNLITLLRNE